MLSLDAVDTPSKGLLGREVAGVSPGDLLPGSCRADQRLQCQCGGTDPSYSWSYASSRSLKVLGKSQGIYELQRATHCSGLAAWLSCIGVGVHCIPPLAKMGRTLQFLSLSLEGFSTGGPIWLNVLSSHQRNTTETNPIVSVYSGAL